MGTPSTSNGNGNGSGKVPAWLKYVGQTFIVIALGAGAGGGVVYGTSATPCAASTNMPAMEKRVDKVVDKTDSNTNRIVALETEMATQTAMLSEMRGDIKTLLLRKGGSE